MEYLENVQHKIRDMLGDTRALRRHHQSQALTMREIVKENFERLKGQFNALAVAGGAAGSQQRSTPRREASPRASTANDMQAFQQDATRLIRDVANLESAIEELQAGAVSQNAPRPVRLQQVDRFSTELNDLSNNLSDLRRK